jgi:predicted MFS family arabinose efflux permease
MKSFLPLLRSEWQLLLFGFAMTFGSSLGQTYFIALFSAEIRHDLNLSHSAFGSIYSAATLASAVLLLWTGTLIDRMNLRHYSYLIICCLAAGCVMLANSRNLPMLFLSMLVLRHLGQGLMGMAGTTSMVRYIDHHKGKASAISTIGFSISEAILPSVVIAALAWLSWRQTWLCWSALLLIVLPLLVRHLLGNHEQRHEQYLQSVSTSQGAAPGSRKRQWTRNEVLRDPYFYLFMPALLAQPMLFTGFMFHQVQLVQEKAWPLPLWGSLYLVYALTTAATKLGAGILIDRIGALRLVPLLCIPMGAAMLVLPSSDSLLVAVLYMLFLGLAVGTYATVSSPFYAQMYGTVHLGSIKSATTSAMVFSSAITPVLMGWFIDRAISIDSMALWAAAYVVLAFVLACYGYYGVKNSRPEVFATGL